MFLRFLSLSFFIMTTASCSQYITDLKDAKVGECYKKVYIPAQYTTKEELIEIAKSSKKLVVTEPQFTQEEKTIQVTPKYNKIKETMAEFETKTKKFPISEKKIYFTIGNTKQIPLKNEFVTYLKNEGLDLDSLKVDQCFIEYAKLLPPKKIKKQYIKKQAYEIIDVEPPKFKTITKKVEIKPAYTKIIKTPAVYETKTEKVLVKPAQKTYKQGKLVEIPATYKEITKKILKSPPTTKVIKFPPTYKEIEVKVFDKESKVSRRVVPPQKDSYDFFQEQKPEYFWLKDDKKSDAKATGLKVCKREQKPRYIVTEVEVVKTPATTKNIEVSAKTIKYKSQKLIKKAQVKTLVVPPQYEKITTDVQLSPPKTAWEKVMCK